MNPDRILEMTWKTWQNLPPAIQERLRCVSIQNRITHYRRVSIIHLRVSEEIAVGFERWVERQRKALAVGSDGV